MAYELIDEKINLWSCSVSDSTKEQTEDILKQLDDGAGIETLTVFYSEDTGRIVINKDNSDYDIYLNLCTTYLLLDSKKREKLYLKIDNEDLRLVMEMLNEALERKVEKNEFKPSNIIDILGYQKVSTIFQLINSLDYRTVLREYPQNMTKNAAYAMFFAGYINGIRAERAKRKAGTVHE